MALMTPWKRAVWLACLGVACALGGPARAQYLYGITAGSAELRVLNPADASTITVLGEITHPDGVDRGRAIAFDPTTGVFYTTFPTGEATDWVFGTVGLDASFTQIAEMADAIRDMTFDASGKLWAVIGVRGPNVNNLVSVDKATGAVTLENGGLPTSGRNKIAYVAATDTLYVLGDTAGPWELYAFSPASPTNMTQVPLSGVVLNQPSQPPMVYDPEAEVFRTMSGATEWVAITLGGVVTMEAGFPGYDLGGLTFDGPFFADGFESGDLSGWN
ncbi:MAG: hypothetical protein AAF560_01775 [Acidobacteriota bacterium]